MASFQPVFVHEPLHVLAIRSILGIYSQSTDQSLLPHGLLPVPARISVHLSVLHEPRHDVRAPPSIKNGLAIHAAGVAVHVRAGNDGWRSPKASGGKHSHFQGADIPDDFQQPLGHSATVSDSH